MRLISIESLLRLIFIFILVVLPVLISVIYARRFLIRAKSLGLLPSVYSFFLKTFLPFVSSISFMGLAGRILPEHFFFIGAGMMSIFGGVLVRRGIRKEHDPQEDILKLSKRGAMTWYLFERYGPNYFYHMNILLGAIFFLIGVSMIYQRI